jgi:L-alanine-DL-glutamate epimerase-like enolase superfamily enzyme
MSQTETGKWWSYEQEGNVGIWTIEDFENLFAKELDEAESHYAETASRDEITATLVVFDEVGHLGSETQDHMTDAWSELAQAVDVERTAYVADGITALAVKSNVTAPNKELEAFESVDDALDWARA